MVVSYSCLEPSRIHLLQAVEDRELGNVEKEVEMIQKLTDIPFTLSVFMVKDWYRDLSPWRVEGKCGMPGFGDWGSKTLERIEKELIPDLQVKTPLIIGGYSLAGLFALWSTYRSNSFAGAACASPTLWFPRWKEFAEKATPQAKCIYLSLGRKEERTANLQAVCVGDRIRWQDEQLEEMGIRHQLEWNEGDHLANKTERMAKAFAWCIEEISRQ